MYEEIPVFPALFFMSGSILYLILHVVLTVRLAGSLKRGATSIAWEVFGIILFGGVMGFIGMFVNHAVMIYIGRFMGSLGLAGASVINQAISVLNPIRSIAVSLLFVAIGMSIYSKMGDRAESRLRRFEGV